MAAAFQNLPASLPAPYRLESGSPGQMCKHPPSAGWGPKKPRRRRRRRRATLRELGQEVRKPGGQSFFLFHFLPEMRRQFLSVHNSLVGGRRGVGSERHQGEIILFGNFSLFKTPFLGQSSVPTSFISFFLSFIFFLPPFKDNRLLFWVPDVLCRHSEVLLCNLLSV